MSDRDALWAALAGWGDGYLLVVRCDREEIYVPTWDRRRFVRALDAHAPCLLGAQPLAQPGPPGTYAPTGVVWASVESERSLGALRRHRHRPTFVFDAGGRVRRTALWALQRPLRGPLWEANRRLAHALGAPKKHAESSFTFDPGRLLYGSGELHDPAVLIGGLPPSPDPHAWRAFRDDRRNGR